ncbi:MAG TPA: DUF4384 domain-containing protein [Thermoanaerobaculia bacterium]|nr:DUF4384 domain-containing protein [Thermoanaerobaculia bacterium]
MAGALVAAPPTPTRLVPVPRFGSLRLRVGLAKVVNLNSTAVPLSHIFESGDRFCITLTANRTGYIALLHRGAAGHLESLWPSNGGTAAIAANEMIVVPPDGNFRLDEVPGSEMVQIVFTLAPIGQPMAQLLEATTGASGTSAIRQIRLRGVVADPSEDSGDVASLFTGDIVEHGVAVVELAIAHRARR